MNVPAAEAHETETFDVKEGEDLSVPCNATDSSDLDVYWTKNDTAERHVVQIGIQLNFTAINRTQAGEYICSAYNNQTRIYEDVETILINVLYPAEVKFLNISPPQLEENEPYTVTCEVDGFPPPRWLIENNETDEFLAVDLKGSVGIHKTPLKNASCLDTGTIMCLADNSQNLSTDPFLSQRFKVFCSPRPRQDSPKLAYASLGSSGILSMHAAGYPYPNYTWTRDDGEPIEGGVQTDTELTSTLNISDVQISDFGNYSLTMENSHGTYTALYQLVARGRPERPYNLNYSDVTYDSVRLYWTSGYDMGTKQVFLVMRKFGKTFFQISDDIEFNYTDHGVGQNWTYVQENLDSDSDIELTIIAYNGFYSSTYQNPGLLIHTLPAPTKNHSNITGVIIGVCAGAGAVIVGGLIRLLCVTVRVRKRKEWDKL